MKLVDILARELKVWPEDLPHATLAQSVRGGVNYVINNRLKWAMPTSPELADDWLTAIVTRAEWQAAVDALNATKVIWRSGEMSDLMRDEFEKAVVSMHVSHGVPPEDAAAFLEIGSNGYRSVSTKSAWWAWQASRECLVIELPIPVDFPDGTGDYHQMIDPDDLIDAIHEAGVKTK